jgi:hypothetical protein
MTKFSHAPIALAIAALSVFGLAACAQSPTGSPTGGVVTPEPAGQATPAPTIKPSPTPAAPAAAIIQINSHSITVETTDGTPIVDIPYTAPLLTAALTLQDAIHEPPTPTPVAANSCGAAYTSYVWGEMTLAPVTHIANLIGNPLWDVITTAPRTPHGTRIESIGHQVVGAATADVVAALPGAATQTVRDPDWLRILVDPQDDNQWGTEIDVKSGSLTTIFAPSGFAYGYDCGF